MSAERRIASLFRELADAFERLDEERATGKRKPRKIESPQRQPDAETMQRVRRTLRHAGVKA